MVSMLADMMCVAAGMAFAFKLRGERRCALSFFGDGATSVGDWHEAMNLAGVQRLPVIFVLEHNGYAYSTPSEQQFAVDPLERAAAYGIAGAAVDGNDVEAVFEATRQARERALRGGGRDADRRATRCGCTATAPTTTPPTCRASSSSAGRRTTRSRSSARGCARSASTSRRSSAAVREEVDARRARGAGDGGAGPGERARGRLLRGRAGAARPRRGAVERLRGAVMDADLPRGDHRRRCARRCARTSACCVLGEDVGAFGGAFKVTDGLQAEFGADRVIDTPISEEAIIGGAVGAAIVGMRPVCEMQFADFVACAFDQLVNVAGKLHYRLGLAAPIVVRLPSGGGFAGGPFHSQNPEAWFMHAPGLKVVAPSTAAGRQGAAAGGDRRPQPGHLPRAQAPLPPRPRRGARGLLHDADVRAHRARGRRPRRDRLRRDGRTRRSRRPRRSRTPACACSTCARSCRSTSEAILGAVRECSKVVIVDEANYTCAAGAQVASLIAQYGFADLDGPVVRVATPDVPIPFAPSLERAVLPERRADPRGLRELLAY